MPEGQRGLAIIVKLSGEMPEEPAPLRRGQRGLAIILETLWGNAAQRQKAVPAMAILIYYLFSF